jgi:hypothetical protein
MRSHMLTVAVAIGTMPGVTIAWTPPSVVIPNVNAELDAPSNQSFPWDTGFMRYQQLYGADQFGGLSGVIDAFAYRLDESFGQPFGPVNISAKIWFGYSDLDPTELTETFDDNISCCKTLVYDGVVTLQSAGAPDFDIIVDVDDVFDYDGTSNLIMEIILPGNAGNSAFDSAGTGLGQGGTPWTDRLWALDPNAQTGSLGGDDGMVTKFIFAENGCFADCDANGTLNILDFICYQSFFQSGDPGADCNGDGVLNILDFICFQSAFQAGCP